MIRCWVTEKRSWMGRNQIIFCENSLDNLAPSSVCPSCKYGCCKLRPTPSSIDTLKYDKNLIVSLGVKNSQSFCNHIHFCNHIQGLIWAHCYSGFCTKFCTKLDRMIESFVQTIYFDIYLKELSTICVVFLYFTSIKTLTTCRFNCSNKKVYFLRIFSGFLKMQWY